MDSLNHDNQADFIEAFIMVLIMIYLFVHDDSLTS